MVLTFAACSDDGSKTPDGTTPEATTPKETTPEPTTPEATDPEDTTPEVTMQEIYDAAQPENIFKNCQSISIREKMDGEVWRERYLTKEYCYDYFASFGEVSDWENFITDDAYYYYSINDSYICYLGITPDGMTGFASLRAESYANSILNEDALKDTIESVEEKDGRITVKTFWSQDLLTENGMTYAKFEYVLDAESRKIISCTCNYAFDDGSSFVSSVEVSYDAEMPERVKTFLKYAEQTEDLRNVTVVSNPGADNEKTESVQVPKGLIVGFRYDEEDEYGFDLYVDAACTESYDPYVNTDSDLTIYVKWSVINSNS
jgi:hypothetical protein